MSSENKILLTGIPDSNAKTVSILCSIFFIIIMCFFLWFHLTGSHIYLNLRNSDVDDFFGDMGLPTKRGFDICALWPIWILISSLLAKCFVSISRIKLTIYEDRVEGTGLGKYYNLGDVGAKNFKLLITQITSVEVFDQQNVLIIYTLNTSYRLFLKNSMDIQNTIFTLQKK